MKISLLMMSPMLISLILFLTSSHVVMADEQFITDTCSKTPYPDACITSLKSNPKSFNADTAGLGAILVSDFISEAQQAHDIVNNNIKITTDPIVLEALERCASKYDVINVADGPSAYDGFTKGNPKFAVDGSNDASALAMECEDGFPAGTSPVSQLNWEIIQQGADAASIARTLL